MAGVQRGQRQSPSSAAPHLPLPRARGGRLPCALRGTRGEGTNSSTKFIPGTGSFSLQKVPRAVHLPRAPHISSPSPRRSCLPRLWSLREGRTLCRWRAAQQGPVRAVRQTRHPRTPRPLGLGLCLGRSLPSVGTPRPSQRHPPPHLRTQLDAATSERFYPNALNLCSANRRNVSHKARVFCHRLAVPHD